MSSYSGRKRSAVMLLVLLAVVLLLDRYLIAGVFPWMPGLAGVTPMLVFLDIPVPLPVIIDLPVIGLFFFFYWLLSYPSQPGGGNWQESRKRVWRLGTRVFAIVLCVVAGGVLFHLCSGLMSREVRNGIDSFGIQLDIYTAIPDYELIHLKGGMILLVCLLIGIRLFAVSGRRDVGTMEVVRSEVSEAEVFLGREVDSGRMIDHRMVDPRIGGFQEKGKWTEATEKAKVTAIPVPVVAPSRVYVN